MIKLINYSPYGSKEAFISKAMIHSMERMDNMTNIIMDGGSGYTVKETPEEILAMPDIETSQKVIDWEQRRYEIAKDVMAAIYTRPNVNGTLLNISLIVNAADALIDELKKGQYNEN